VVCTACIVLYETGAVPGLQYGKATRSQRRVQIENTGRKMDDVLFTVGEALM
jgi:hypothetical protein